MAQECENAWRGDNRARNIATRPRLILLGRMWTTCLTNQVKLRLTRHYGLFRLSYTSDLVASLTSAKHLGEIKLESEVADVGDVGNYSNSNFPDFPESRLDLEVLLGNCVPARVPCI